MQAQKVLELLGYSAKEAKVYLAVLSLGECHISDIAEKVKMPRSSTQSIIDKLNKDGLVNFYVMRRYKYWVAENPRHLLEILRHREQAIEEVMPNLLALRKTRQGRRFKKKGDCTSACRMFADTIRQPVLITNEKSEIQYVNRAWEEAFGYLFEEVEGKNPRMLKSGRTAKDVYAEGSKKLREGKMYQTDKVIDKHKDGHLLPLVTTIFPMEVGGHLCFVQVLEVKK